MGPDVRASRPTTTDGLTARRPDGRIPSRAHVPKAAAQPATTSGLRSVPTRPRTPDTLTIKVSDMVDQFNESIRRDVLPWHGWAGAKAVTAGSEWGATSPRQTRAGTPGRSRRRTARPSLPRARAWRASPRVTGGRDARRSEEHTSELQSLAYLVCRLLLEKKKTTYVYS